MRAQADVQARDARGEQAAANAREHRARQCSAHKLRRGHCEGVLVLINGGKVDDLAGEEGDEGRCQCREAPCTDTPA